MRCGRPTPPTRRLRSRGALGGDSLEQDARRLVGRVLGDKLAAEGGREDRAAEGLSSTFSLPNRGANVVRSLPFFLYFRQESPLLRCGRKGHGHRS
ncbi:MAG: hypothetical protein ACRDLK_02335 [Gaiellaceae bacterium]